MFLNPISHGYTFLIVPFAGKDSQRTYICDCRTLQINKALRDYVNLHAALYSHPRILLPEPTSLASGIAEGLWRCI